MSQSTSLSIPESLKPALHQLQCEVAQVEKALLELQQKKHEFLQDQLRADIYKLEILADSINVLANSLESEILKFKKTAVEINHLYHTVQDSPGFKTLGWDKSIMPNWKPLDIWEVNDLTFSFPTVIRRQSQFILSVRAVNLHQEIVPQQSVEPTTQVSPRQDAVKNGVEIQIVEQIQSPAPIEMEVS